jgi:hypothetical protein
MASIMHQLAVFYGVDLSQQRASLALEMPERSERWIITNLDGARLSVTRCVVEEGNCLGLELDMVFALHPDGWEPVELVHSTALWQEYRQAAKAAGVAIYDEQGDTIFAHFTEYWAQQIEAQGWLTLAYKVEEADAEWRDTPSGRMPGCQSTHAGPCYGELWQCATCDKTVCFAEGSDNHPELCDDCWVKSYGGLEDDIPF